MNQNLLKAPATSARRPRPRRGTPDATRDRLIDAAAMEFNRVGYGGTDSNRLARSAGYAPATFYKHFRDKRAIFLAAYERWVGAEWSEVERILDDTTSTEEAAAKIVELTLMHHRRWRGLRASLRVLVADDPKARAFYRAQRRRQIKLIARLRGGAATPGQAERDAVQLYTLERTCDAIAEDEVKALGLSTERILDLLREIVAHSLITRRK